MRKNLIHIGYAKAGSTFLQKWFKAHPQLQYADKGIGGYKNVHQFIDGVSRDMDYSPHYYVTSDEILGTGWFDSQGSVALSIKNGKHPDKIKVEKMQKKMSQTLFDVFPMSKILIVTRGFEGIVTSGYSEYIKLGGDLKFLDYLSSLESFFLQWLNIDALFRQYAEFFGEENIILLPYELLKENQDEFVRLLEERLGIDHFQLALAVQNPSLTRKEINWYRVISKVLLSPLKAMMPQKTQIFIYSQYNYLMVRRNSLGLLVNLMDKLLKPNYDSLSIPENYLMKFSENATVLRRFSYYQKFLPEYLLN